MLLGFPLKEYELQKGEERKWVSEKEYDITIKHGWEPTYNNRTGYAPPAWLSKLQKHDTSILLLDDFNRCLQHFQNSIMEIVDQQEYYSWKLPKGCTVILTGNPAGEDYMVSEQDQAHETRYFTYNATFSIEDWARYAEEEAIDGRSINFFLRFWQEVLHFKDGDKKRTSPDQLKTNPRQWTKFFNAIGYIKDFSTKENLELIQLIGQGIVGEEVINFITFINQKLDKLITPEEMMTLKFEDVKKKIKETAGSTDDKDYRAEIASILTTRLTNWLIVQADTKPVTKDTLERIEKIFVGNLFGKDLNFKFIRDLFASQDRSGVKKFDKVLFIPSIREILAS